MSGWGGRGGRLRARKRRPGFTGRACRENYLLHRLAHYLQAPLGRPSMYIKIRRCILSPGFGFKELFVGGEHPSGGFQRRLPCAFTASEV